MEMLRLSKIEQKNLRDAGIKINKKLIMAEMQPVKDSELIHLILNDVLKRIAVTKRGEIIVE
jgi:hypothetical protein